MDVLTWEAYQKMGLKEQTLSITSSLYGFANHLVEGKCCITFTVTLGDDKHMAMKYVQFFVVGHLMTYNAIFERSIMRMVKMIVLTFCMKIKFLMRIEIKFMRSDQQTTRQCHMLLVKQAQELALGGKTSQQSKLSSQALDLDSLDIMDEERSEKPEETEQTKTLQQFYDDKERTLRISSTLPPKEKGKLV